MVVVVVVVIVVVVVVVVAAVAVAVVAVVVAVVAVEVCSSLQCLRSRVCGLRRVCVPARDEKKNVWKGGNFKTDLVEGSLALRKLCTSSTEKS